MPLPTFVIAGAQKAGTTSLSAALRQHPQVSMSRRKELHFFDRHFARGLDWYRSQFDPKPHHTQVGEATPVYMYDHTARERMAATLPQARIVIILRNPVDRAYSHYWHMRRLGRETLPTFEEAIAAEPQRATSEDVRTRAGFAYVDRGHYMSQIDRIVEAHGPDRVHVMLLDNLIVDRVDTTRSLLEFLDVDPGVAADLEIKKRNTYRVSTGSGKTHGAEYGPMAPQTRSSLQEVYAESNARLAGFLGRDLSHWQRD